jgi:hypothetical protein
MHLFADEPGHLGFPVPLPRQFHRCPQRPGPEGTEVRDELGAAPQAVAHLEARRAELARRGLESELVTSGSEAVVESGQHYRHQRGRAAG